MQVIPHKLFINCSKRESWYVIIHFPLWAYSFLTLHGIAFMCISNLKDVSNIKLNCSFDETC